MIHTKLRELRKKSNKRLQDVAKANELSVGYLSQIETGKVEPSISQLRRLAAYYGVGVVYF
ncbi:helix-turn-helix transcriptional regulator [Ochrobactrum tritici]|nr:helix-turn-helix transcriptional regulator [Brucella tritici]